MLKKEELLDSVLQNNSPKEKTDWFLLANQLRQQNQELIKTIVSLEETLERKQHSQDSLLLEKLAVSETKINQLEKELLIKEENYQILSQQVKELKIRLFRQQRFTLHYKAALNNRLDCDNFMTIEPWDNALETEEELNPNSATFQLSPTRQYPQKDLELPSFLIEDN